MVHRTKKQFGKNNTSWIDIDEKEIIRLYIDKGHNLNFIAKKFGVSRDVIRLRLKKNNIKIRTFSQQYKLDQSLGRQYNFGVNKDKKNGQYIHGRRVGNKKNRKEYLIAVKDRDWKCEVCGSERTSDSFDLVVHHKDRNNRNNKTENLQILCQYCHCQVHKKNGDYKGRNLIILDEEKIIEMYNDGMSLTEIGKFFSVSYNTIRERLKKNNIRIRTFSEQYWYGRS